MKKKLFGLVSSLCLTLATVLGAQMAVAPQAHANAQADICINDGVSLTCLWALPDYGLPSQSFLGKKVHGGLGPYNLGTSLNNAASSLVSVPGPTAYTYYYDAFNGTGNILFVLPHLWVWKNLAGSGYDNRISSVWISPSNL